MNEWAINYVGKRFQDCWDLVRKVYEAELDVKLPDHARGLVAHDLPEIVRRIKAGEQDGQWRKLSGPENLSVAAMSRGRFIHHVGVYTDEDGGKVIHAEIDHPAVAHSMTQLVKNGYQRVEFYVLA